MKDIYWFNNKNDYTHRQYRNDYENELYNGC